MKDKIIEILKSTIEYAEDADGLGRYFGINEAAESIEALYSKDEEKLHEVTYRYTNRTDDLIHVEQVYAENCVYAANKVCANHNYEVEWHTVKELNNL